MSASENLKVAVEEGDIYAIRDCFWAASLNGPDAVQEALDYVLSHGIPKSALFEADDGQVFPGQTTEENYQKLGGKLSVNFSERKLRALMAMGRQLWPAKPKPEAQTPREDTQGPYPYPATAAEGESSRVADFLRTAGKIAGKIVEFPFKLGGDLLDSTLKHLR